ncbi:MAG: tetratricopeptide repeat protein [Planctomycetota bacterium]|jgi:outer membrane protein assembly factor BamD (BamD/ComL family)
MLKHRMRFAVLVVWVVLWACFASPAGTVRLDADQERKAVNAEGPDKFRLAVAETKELVDTGQAEAASEAFKALKEDFPEITGPDFDMFVEAELFYCKERFVKAARSYDKLLTEHPKSSFCQAALERQFDIASAYLAGRKKVVLGFIKLKGYAEGVRIMEKITDRAGIDSPLGTEAALAVARSYEERQKYNEAYLKWWEISLEWQTGQVGKDALLGMARCKRAAYNKEPEHKRPLYDSSRLSTAKSCYERFRRLYPIDAEQIGVDEILRQIDEQLARKQLSIGQYYQAVGNRQSANLYYDMVVTDWPGTEAAEVAKQLLAVNQDTTSDNLAPVEE